MRCHEKSYATNLKSRRFLLLGSLTALLPFRSRNSPMTHTHSLMSITKYLSLALAVAVAACESPAGPVAGPGDAQFARTRAIAATAMTINPASLTAGQPGEIVATLWTAGHPLGGKLMNLYIDGALVDSKRGSRLGTAEFSVPGLAAGDHSVIVTFDGDTNFAPSEATRTVTAR